MLYPEMLEDELPAQDRFTEYTGAAVPVPVRAAVIVGVCPLLVKVKVPLAVPVAVGLKVTVNGTLWPAAIVAGRDNPLMVNTALFEVAAVTVTLAPLAVRVPDAVPLVPTTTSPRASVVGETLSCPVAAAPVPDSAMLRVGLEALEVTVTAPVALPAVVGVKVTLKVALWPEVSVTGAVMPLIVKPVPLIAT
jgi:hypothetical protein